MRRLILTSLLLLNTSVLCSTPTKQADDHRPHTSSMLSLDKVETLASIQVRPTVLSIDNSADITDRDTSILRLGWASSDVFQTDAYGIYKVTKDTHEDLAAIVQLTITHIEGNAHHGNLATLKCILENINSEKVEEVHLSYITSQQKAELEETLKRFKEATISTSETL